MRSRKDFTSEENIVPTTSINEATTDASVIPVNHALLNEQNMRVYSFPYDKSASNSAWIYNAEALVKNGGPPLDITLHCIQYSPDAATCQRLLKDILPTLQQ
jgi:hypothetical protein